MTELRTRPAWARWLSALALMAILLAQPTLSPCGSTSHVKPTEDELIARGYRMAGEKTEDKFNELPGSETTIRIYKKGQDTIGLYSLPNGQVYGYAVKTGSQPITAYIDEYNTGYCEKDAGDGDIFTIDFSSYRINPRRAGRRR